MPTHVRHPWPTLVVTVLAILLAAPAAAQFATSTADQTEAAEMDFRLGGLWPEDAYATRPSLGGRIGLYLWNGERSRRLSLQVTGDYRSLGYQAVSFEGLTDRFRTGRRVYLVGSSLGFDVVRTPTFTVDVRGGAMVRRVPTGLDVLIREGGSLTDDVWQTVCHLEGFREDCGSDWGLSGTLAVGARRYFGGAADYYAGVDYTRIFNRYHVLVGSFGVRLR